MPTEAASPGTRAPAAPPLRLHHDLPGTVEAGASIRWTCTLEASRELAARSRIGLARRWPSDWGVPQLGRPDAADHLVIEPQPAIALRIATSREPSWHPFDHLLLLELLDPLPAGGRLVLRFGHDGPGQRVQTLAELDCPLLVRLQEPGSAGWTEIACPRVDVVGGTAARLILVGPSTVAVGEPFALRLCLEDRWGNPASGPRLEVEIEGLPGRHALDGSGAGPLAVEARLEHAGVHRFTARDHTGLLTATSNPIDCRPAPEQRVYWGDLHGQSRIGCGAGSFERYLEHARDAALLDFVGHQANCFLVRDGEWEEQRRVTTALHAPGIFLPLLGYEWSGETEVGGDRNLYYPGDEGELRRCRRAFADEPAEPGSDLPHVRDLHAHFRDRDVLGVLHVGGRTSNLDWHEPAFERLLEVHSTHATSEWLLREALARGYRMGVVAGSDGVDGRPGTSHPGRMAVRNLRGGLTGVALPEPTRAALWQALCARRTWGTTGARILLELEADGLPMGSELRTAVPPTLRVRVEGTAPLEAVELMCGERVVFAAPLAGEGRSDRLRVAWSGLSARGNFARARMVWDGGLAVEEGRILEARGWAFDTPEEGITAQGQDRVAWRSLTAGDWDGVILRLEETPRTTLVFTTGPLTCRLPLATLGGAPRLIAREEPMRRLELRRLPRVPPPASWSGMVRDPDPSPGERAYWLRVRQSDGEQAWSSPIWVTLEAPAGARAAETPGSAARREER